MLYDLKVYQETYQVDKNINLETPNTFFESLFADVWLIDNKNYFLQNNFISYGDALYTECNSTDIHEIFCNGSRYFNNKQLPPHKQLSSDLFLKKTSFKQTEICSNVFIFNRTNNWTGKYFHFLTDIILKLPILNKRYTSTVLLTSSLNCRFTSELVNLLTSLSFKIILAKPDTRYICNDSFLISSPVDLYARISVDQLKFIKKIYNILPAKKYKKIYLARRPAPDPVAGIPQRAILNEAALIQYMQANDYKIIYPEDISISECSSYIRGAEKIVSAHGSQLTNIVFAKPKTQIIEILPENYFSKSLACYRALSIINNLDYRYINGLTPEKYWYKGARFRGKKEICTSNMYVTEAKLKLLTHT